MPLALLGHPSFVTVPSMLRAERGELVACVYVDLANGTDLLGYVEQAQRDVERAVPLSAGERLEWTGQYQLLAAGQHRLMIIAPIVALAMLLLLLLQFRSITEALIVLVGAASAWARTGYSRPGGRPSHATRDLDVLPPCATMVALWLYGVGRDGDDNSNGRHSSES